MARLIDLSLAEAKDCLDKRDFTATELVEAHIDAAVAARPLNTIVTETTELALSNAAISDARWSRGEARLLEGIPLVVKDLFCTKNVRTTACSKILGEFTPTYESTVTEKLWGCGAVMLGKTNMDEFAMGSSNETSHFGPAVNPWRRQNDLSQLVPGGSSGGSGAAVAGRFAIASIGTDTGGSIRQPAAFTGVVGLKPTYGRCSRWGIIAFASSLDQAGPMTRTVRDNAIMLGAMAGYDPKDATSTNLGVPNFEAAITGDVRGIRIGIPEEYRVEQMPREIESLWEKGQDWLRQAGAEIININLPHTKYALPTYYIVAPAEASSNLARYDGVRYGIRVDGADLDDMYRFTRAAGFGDEVRRRVLIGTYVLSAGYYDAYYLQAQKLRRLIADDFQKVYERVDAILTPSTPYPAFSLGAKLDDPLSMYLNDVFTVPANLAGLPGISVPAGLSEEGLPLGLQVLGPSFGEEIVYRVAGVIEEAAGSQNQPEEWWL